MSVRTALLGAIVLIASGCATGGRSVTAEGWASGRALALEDAQRRAVEQVAGVKLSASSLVVNGALVSQRARTAARGTLKSYKIVAEARAEGGVRVRIRAVVEPASSSKPWPAGAVVLIEGDGPAREALARAWAAAGGEETSEPRRADLIVRVELRSMAVSEPRIKPFVSRRTRAVLRFVGARDRTRWTVSKEAAALGLDADEASDAAAASALREAVAASAAPSSRP